MTYNSSHVKLRLLLAALHFNENFGRAQAVTKSGKERIEIVFPTQKRGDFTPKIVIVARTYSKLLQLACIIAIFIYSLQVMQILYY